MRRLFLLTIVCVCSVLSASTTTITIEVKNLRGKPVEDASVVVKFIRGHDLLKLGRGIRREWEVRTNQQGSIKIPSIPQGQILVQVIAKGYQTFGQTFDVDEPAKTLEVRLNPPQPQYSAH